MEKEKEKPMFTRIDIANVPTELKEKAREKLYKRGITLSTFVKIKLRELLEDK